MADNTEAIKNEAGNGEQKKPLEPLPQTATKQYTWTGADGTKINYTATAEMIPVRANDGQLIGHMFMFSQVSDQEDKSDRPVTFCWNGGPVAPRTWSTSVAWAPSASSRWHGAPEGRR